jgi:hypothetical protein
MPVFPEEPEIHESIPGPGVPFPRESDAVAPRTPVAATAAQASSPTVQAPAPVPSPRPGPPRPAPPRGDRPSPRPARIPKPGPAARRAPAVAAPEIQLVSATAQTALERADEAVDLLLETGRGPSEVLVLTTGEAHPWQQHEASFGEDRYWAQLEEGGDVFYADALTPRPAHREIVVLAVNGADDRLPAALPAALGRAQRLLVVCGDAVRLRNLLDGVPTPAHA